MSKEIAFRNQRCANRTARGTLLTDRASASERQQEGAQGSQQHVCASCSAHGAIGGRHCSPDGPWFCLGCWGELDGEALSSPAKRRWWDAHGAWLASVVRPSLREQPIFAAGGEVHGEKFSVITDPANGHFPGVGADRMWPAADRLCVCLADMMRSQSLGCFAGTCIELGAGVGVPGMLLARRCAELKVYLTDLPWLLPLVEENVSANFDQGDERRPQTCALRWGCAADCAALPSAPQLVIGSDVVYVEQDLPRLLDTLATLGGAVNLISQQHRGGFRRNALLEAAKALGGWDVSTVAAHSDDRCSIFMLKKVGGSSDEA